MRMLAFVGLLVLFGLPVHASSLSYVRADGRRVWLPGRVEAGVLEIPFEGRLPATLRNRLIVRTRTSAGVPPGWLEKLGLRVVRPMRGLDFVWLLEARDPVAVLHACTVLNGERPVIWAVPDFRLPADLHHRPGDPLYVHQWHLSHSAGQDIAVEEAWDLTRGEAQVVVAVVDTGVDPGHPDLDPARMVSPRNEIADSQDPSPSELAIDSHGTACMGLIAASMDNDTGVAGICPGCSWMPVRVFERGGYMNLSAISDGITWAVDQGAWVISNSWGIAQELIDGGIDPAPIQQAVQYAVQQGRDGKGSVVLFAAGNGDGNLNAEPIGPDELPAMEETVAVGGCDHAGFHARYSDYGSCVSVVAPTWSGNDGDPKIVSIDTSGAAGANQGGIFHKTDTDIQEDWSTGEAEPDAEGHYTSHFTGTSAATPIAAGVAALVLSVDAELGWRDVKGILQETAEKIGGDVYDGSGHSDEYGHGRVHAARAVAMARYGTDRQDGEPCWMPINCLGDCVREPPRGDGPVCATACETTKSCAGGLECLDGHCFPRAEPDGGGEPVVEGGCACGSGPVGDAGLGLGLLLALAAFGLTWFDKRDGGP